jgi:TonB family protein
VIQVPGGSVEDAVKALNRSAAPSGSANEVTFDQGGSGPGLNLPASPGRAQGGIKLLSNPEGVDFRPYLIQVMAAIRRNWFAVYPEAAKTGMRGEVVLQFRVAKGGLVAKVVYSGQSPSKALNEAAVSAISASNPFPPLPGEFKGDHIDLQMRFLYNMPR